MKTVTIDILEPRAEKLLEDLAELDLIKIKENNEPKKKRLGFGSMKGLIVHMSDDFNEPLEDFKDYM
jgi:hypothetical protein